MKINYLQWDPRNSGIWRRHFSNPACKTPIFSLETPQNLIDDLVFSLETPKFSLEAFILWFSNKNQRESGVSNENMGISNESLGVSNENMGVLHTGKISFASKKPKFLKKIFSHLRIVSRFVKWKSAQP